MKITSKTYQINNNKKYIKTNNLFFIFNGINRNSIDWLLTEQNLRKTNFKYQKIINKTVYFVTQKSVYSNLSSIIAGIIFFIKPNDNLKTLSKKIILNKFESFLFILSAVKLNNKVYSTQLIKNVSFLDYSNNKLLLFQFLRSNIVFCSRKLKKSK